MWIKECHFQHSKICIANLFWIEESLLFFPLFVFFPDGLSSKDGLSLLFIGESAYMSCNINSGSIPNFSLSSFRLKVKKCDNMMNLKADSVARNGMYAITVQDPIIDLPCPQKYLDYYCYYKIDGEDCLVGRKFIYFECKHMWLFLVIGMNFLYYLPLF